PQAGGRPGGGRGNWQAMMAGGLEKDLGNIAISPEDVKLDEVVIEGEARAVTLALDRKIFRVDKNIQAVGGTAEDALRNVPSLSIDLDGNLTLRNAAPQLFVDGRPTTLTLEEIPADGIETVEVITNPSAKFDASGGQAGIVNIVMKKNRRIGYNGSIRAGVDQIGGFNLGGSLNIREGKVNAFLSANHFNRVSIGEGTTDRNNLIGTPLTDVFQESDDEFNGGFTSIRGGIDWFIDNRSTLTIQGSYTNGDLERTSDLLTRTDSLFDAGTTFSRSSRVSASDINFRNRGVSALYKYLFPKKGREWTADVNYNHVDRSTTSNFQTDFLTDDRSRIERQTNGGGVDFMTFQTDYVDPIAKNMKIEAGLRAAIRTFDNDNENLVLIPGSSEFQRIPNFADVYEFEDAVYAAYGTFSHEFQRWGYQVGLRVESSEYTGTLPESGDRFENDFPLSLFPSTFVTYKVNEEDNIQFSYSRRINRPSFFQLIPFTDFADSLNLRRGNPNLLPEFTNSLEVSYQNILNKGNDFLVSIYYKEANDLITTYQFFEFVPELDREVVVSTLENSNISQAYGMEVTVRNSFGKNVELISNVNLYNSRVDASNVEQGLVNNQFTWFAKENLTVKIPGGFNFQVTGQYQSRAAFTPSSGGRFRGWRRTSNSAQGYSKGYLFLDLGLRKDLFKRKLSLTLSVSDVLKTREGGTFTESTFFVQDSWRIRNQQLFRINLSYRFGKPDMSLFKRKNNNFNSSGSELMN
ncbi:MAG: TonB-dependent receptor, partial [Bacteroidota bacterium]